MKKNISFFLFILIVSSTVSYSRDKLFDNSKKFDVDIVSKIAEASCFLKNNNATLGEDLISYKMNRLRQENIKYVNTIGVSDKVVIKGYGELDSYSNVLTQLILEAHKDKAIKTNKFKANNYETTPINITNVKVSVDSLPIAGPPDDLLDPYGIIYEENWNRVGECIWVSIGVRGFLELVNGNPYTVQTLMKTFSKTAGRALGAIGAAIAVYDFGQCMGYWSSERPFDPVAERLYNDALEELDF